MDNKSDVEGLEKVGVVTGYYAKIGVGVVKVEKNIKKGDKLRIKGHTTDFEQVAESMQINKENIDEANPGDEIGLKVRDRVRPNDVVYKI